MTWSAPSDRTSSAFLPLHTPVTCAPSALAICTANVPTPPDAPLTRTLCPGWTFARSRSPCRAVTAAMGAAAACSNVRLAGFRATARSCGTVRYSANAPALPPKTSSPGLNRVTFLPTDSTVPAKSTPRLAPQVVPVERVDGRRANPHQELVVPGNRLLDLLEAKDVRRAVLVPHHRS